MPHAYARALARPLGATRKLLMICPGRPALRRAANGSGFQTRPGFNERGGTANFARAGPMQKYRSRVTLSA